MPEPVTTPKPFVFVLMPFDPKFSDIYKFGVKGAAEEVGAYAERLDEQIFVEGMLDRIFNQISRADVIVADMTGRNANVFYEVGYAHALGKITLLLTQNANDIPFDLKQRQHTVYGGSIDVLRRDLTDRLRWAVAESRRRARGPSTERMSVRVGGLEIPPTGASREVPTVDGTATSRSFEVPLHIRNDSYDGLSGITHVYLFTEEKAGVVPCTEVTTPNWTFPSFSTVGPPVTLPEIVPVAHFTANPIDASDGLMHQFRLPVTVATLPPGAVETTSIDFMLMKGVDSCDSLYRLRLHTQSQFHDFTFRLKISFQAPGPESGASGQMNKGKS